MKAYLLDVNVLIALAWPSHVLHHQAQRWFAQKRATGFATCPITQTGFVRISSNPNFTPEAVSPQEALALLNRITALAGHRFWPDDLPLHKAIGADPVMGHRQVTDAYLLALAAARGGRLATLDRTVLSLAKPARGVVELLQDS